MRNWLKTLLFISAFSPALITLAYVRYDIYGFSTDVVQLGAVGVLGLIIPFFVMKLVGSQGESFNIQVKKIESSDFMLLAFVGSYLLPLVLKAAEVSVNSIAAIIAVLGVLLWLINYLPAHPLLRILNFHFYKVESSAGMVYTLISKKRIRHPSEVTKVKRISETMLVGDN